MIPAALTGRRVAAWTAGVGATFLLAWGSRAPLPGPGQDGGALRLAWSARAEWIETCRTPTAEELEGVPVHMRRAEICEGTTAAYQVEVRVDDSVVVDREVHGGGIRQDRPLYLFHELPVAPGPHRVAVRWVRLGRLDTLPPLDSTDRRRPVPRRLNLDTLLTVPERGVVLVTYAPDERRLAVRSPPPETR